MGAIGTKEPRRISFDNQFALSPPIVMEKSIIEDESLLSLDELAAVDKGEELLLTDSNKSLEIPDYGELDYWNRRTELLKKEHRIINKILEEEYEKTMEKNNKLIEVPSTTTDSNIKFKPCFELRSKIIKCYEDNRLQPLMCATIVKDFNESVAACRVEQ